jgi:conjugative transfer signal peptidase TraF
MFFNLKIYENTSNSIKRGTYLAIPYINLAKGNTYIVCLKGKSNYLTIMSKLGLPKGECDNGYESLLKRVVATPGDYVAVDNQGVFVNNTLINNSKAEISHNEIMLHPQIGYKQKLKDGEFFVMGDTVRSFDSRYFGPVTSKDIKLRAIYLGDLN